MQTPTEYKSADQFNIHRKRHRWQMVVFCLACVVVFVTTYSLILPAITMETNTYCGYEEHEHKDSCYSCALDFSKESEADTKETSENAESGSAQGNTSKNQDKATTACNHENCTLVCGMTEHKHTDLCYNRTHKVVLSVRCEDKAESDWKVTITANHNDILSDLLKDTDVLPSGKTALEVKWYDAKDNKEVSLEEAVTKNIKLYALDDIDLPQKDATSLAEETTVTEEEKEHRVSVDDTFTYQDDNFIVKINVNGEGVLPQIEETIPPETNSTGEVTQSKAVTGIVAEADRSNLGTKSNSDSEKLTLNIKPVSSSDAEYADIADYVKKTSVADSTLAMEVLRYSLTYDDQELDLSDCKVTAEIIPNKAFISEAASMTDGSDGEAEIGIVVTAYEKKSDNMISDIDSIYFTDKTADDENTMTVELNDDTIVLYAGSTFNPNFTVEYYAFIDRLDEPTASIDSTKKLDIINTSAVANGGLPKLPENGVTPAIKQLYIDDNSNVAVKKGINQPWTKIFNSQNCEYIKTPNLSYFNKFYNNANYKLIQIKIQHTVNGQKVWHAFVGDFSKLHFTNRSDVSAGTDWSKYNTWISLAGKGKENTTAASISTENNDIFVLIEDGALIQLACLPTDGMYNNSANFYDYDITDGYIYKSANSSGTKYNTSTQRDNDGITWYANTKQQGINNSLNYKGSGTKLAFGNNNVNTGLGSLKWDGNLLNMANTVGNGGKASYKECTFGLVSKLDANGNIVYSNGVNAPNLFDENGTTIGKTVYRDYSLDFERTGDSYTLKAVRKGTDTVTGDLMKFIDRFNWNKTRRIWSNLYWPMDTAESFGADNHDLKFGNPVLKAQRIYFNGTANGAFPEVDFYNIDRNAYFGMHYAVNFSLTEDYVGPLEYTFFGDDDMWVFLDGQLVCDIGGVHSSVGEYVDLWDYLQQGDAGTHRLDFYFTERGASGSTCWMHFTLPSVSAATPEQNTGDIRVEKDLRGSNTDQEFEFNIHFTDEEGNHLTDDYAYSRYDADGNYIESDIIIWDGGKFKLRGGEYIIVKYLPDGTKYTITENTYSGYNTSVSVDGVIIDGNTATGQIDIKHAKQIVVSVINTAGIRLPATGGSGTQIYIFSGLLLTATAIIYGYRLWRKSKKRGGRKKTPD